MEFVWKIKKSWIPVDFSNKTCYYYKAVYNSLFGALAQLGERYTGSVEVSGSIPLCSTTSYKSEPCAVRRWVRIYFYRPEIYPISAIKRDGLFLWSAVCFILIFQTKRVAILFCAASIHHKLVQKDKLTVQNLYIEKLMLMKCKWNHYVGLFRGDLWKSILKCKLWIWIFTAQMHRIKRKIHC